MSYRGLRRVFAAVGCTLLAACSGPDSSRQPASVATPVQTVEELLRTDRVVGAGEGLSQGQVAVVHYTGWLYDANAAEQRGRKFDSSRDRGEPFRFTVGAGRVIKGWDEGVQGMRVGGQRTLVIPAHLGYGAAGSRGVIPPNAPLLFDIELLAIE
jgi:FKBP-type peptidyl-prolyl cis-trans isomerase FkpA